MAERAGLSRDQTIRWPVSAAMVTYTGRLTKRKGWPYLRDLREQAGFRITRAERKLYWDDTVKRKRMDALLDRDWSDAWETLPEAPDLVLRGDG